jgi:hypothetical protein
VSGFSTDTDYYKGKESNMIINGTIDPIEFRKEMDRVYKVLTISEYPEFLSSGSHSEVNVSNKVTYTDDNIINIKNLDTYFQKALIPSNLDVFNKKASLIETQLKQINNYEKVLLSMDGFKDKVTLDLIF